jgi:hypothetical protein
MKNFSEQRSRQDLLQAFKETTARFNRPLPGILNRLDVFEGRLRELHPNLPLIDFSPFTRVETPVPKRSEPLLEVAPTDRAPVSRGRGKRDSSSQFGAVSAPNRSPEPTQHTRDNGSVDSLKHAATVPVFKVAPDPRHLSGDTHINTPSGQTGTREQARPLPRRIRESGAGEKPVHVLDRCMALRIEREIDNIDFCRCTSKQHSGNARQCTDNAFFAIFPRVAPTNCQGMFDMTAGPSRIGTRVTHPA